jgi:hypothetical protein
MTEHISNHQYQEYKTHGPEREQQAWRLIRKAICNRAILPEDEQYFVEALAISNDNVGFHTDAKKPHRKTTQQHRRQTPRIRNITPLGHPIVKRSITYQEMIEAATYISQLLENKVGFAITRNGKTIYVGDFNPMEKRDIIYIQAPESDQSPDKASR